MKRARASACHPEWADMDGEVTGEDLASKFGLVPLLHHAR